MNCSIKKILFSCCSITAAELQQGKYWNLISCNFQKIFFQNLTIILRDETFAISGENPGIRYKVKKNALHLMFDIIIPEKYNMTLIWNKHMNFFIKISRETQVLQNNFLKVSLHSYWTFDHGCLESVWWQRFFRNATSSSFLSLSPKQQRSSQEANF